MTLQVFYDIKVHKLIQSQSHRDLPKLRKVLFWDTRMESIDWEKQFKSVIRRVFERGNENEKSEVTRFYGPDKINIVLEEISRSKQPKK